MKHNHHEHLNLDTFEVGQLAEFHVPPDHRFAKHNGVVVQIAHDYRNWSVSSHGRDDPDDPYARDDYGYAVTCDEWGKGAAHDQGFWFCAADWLRPLPPVN